MTMKKKSSKRKKPIVVPVPKNRRAYIALRVGDSEQRILEQYFKKYKVTNKSRWLRELATKTVFQKMVTDYPMLFNESEMRR